MNARALRQLLCVSFSLNVVAYLRAAEPPTIANVQGGLVVQLGAAELDAAERKVPAPMWDGLAIAENKVFLSTLTGTVLCLGNTSK